MRLRTKIRRRSLSIRPVLVVLEERALLATLYVSHNPTLYPLTQYATIQAAVTAANPGDTIDVYPGTYTEQVVIPVGEDGLTLQSVLPQQATIQSPGALNDAVVDSGSQNVTIEGFTISGPSAYGVLVSNLFLNIPSPPPVSANVLDNSIAGAATAVRMEYAGGTVQGNQISNFQTEGISIVYPGTGTQVLQNTVVGLGPTSTVVQNGITVGYGASALVQGNSVSGDVYTPQSYVAEGIELYQAGTVTVNQNTLSADDVGIGAFGTTGPVITNNTLSGSTFDGIELRNFTTDATVSGNNSSSNAFDGIYINNGSSDNSITNNTFDNNGEDGINNDLSSGLSSTGNTISGNQTIGNAQNPIYPPSPGPVITAAAVATPNPVTATFATLSVRAADPTYDSSTLTYTWVVTSAPMGAPTPTFASNGTFGSQSARTTFYQAGTYTFMVTITDPSSLTATSSVTVTVAQTPTAITVTPASVTVADGATQMFTATATATATDQFGQALAQQPTFTWSVDSGGAGGTINGSGLYTAPASGSGTDTVRATSGAVSGTAAVTVTATTVGNAAPTVATPATASPSTVTGTSTSLTALGADSNYAASALTYTWAAASIPAGAAVPTFSINGTNPAQQTTVTFYQAGTYTFQATIEDPNSLTVTSNVTVTVAQTLTQITVAPATAPVTDAATQLFTATATDQFGQTLVPQPTLNWSVDAGGAGGSVNAGGLYTAPASGSGTDTVRATSGAITGSTTLTVIAPPTVAPPTVATQPAASPQTITGTTTTLSVLGADGFYPSSALIYTWAPTPLPTGAPAPTFSANGTNPAQQTLVTFYQAGVYTFQVTIENPSLLTTTSSVTVTVAQTLTQITVAPTTATVADAATHMFTAIAADQFGQALASQPTMIWSVDAGGAAGTINASGVYTAPASGSGTDTVRATSGGVSGTAAVTVTVTMSGTAASASFVGTDTTTQGNWLGTYGQDGYDIAPGTANAIAPNLPAYANVSLSGSAIPYTWNDSGANGPLFPETPSGNGHVETAWYSNTAFSIQLNLTDGQVHRVSLYAIDWVGNLMRQEQIDIINTATGQVLDAESIANFANGVYLTWNLSGDVTIRVTNTLQPNANAVVNALFFGSPATAAAPASASFVGTDTATQGNWLGTYGQDGYDIAPGTANAIAPNLPAYANVSFSGSAIPYTWNDSGANGPLFPETPSGNGHVETAWYSNTAFSIQLNLTDGQVHRVSLYAIDWVGNLMRQEQIDIINTTTGQVLDTESIANFANGVYLTWDLSGDVTIRVTNTLQPNANAVVNALFFGAPSSRGPVITAAASATLNPATATFATLSVGAADPNYDSSTLTYTWAVTSAPTGGRTPTFASNGTFGSQSTRTTFYQAGTYTFMVTITDPSSLTATSSVTVTVAQTPTAITVTPASVTVADGATQMFTATATATDQFGQALAQQPTFTWSVDSGGAGGTINGSGLYTAPASGSGTDTVRATSGAVSGTATVTVTATVGGTSASASFVGTDTATQGNWLGTYGQDGYDIAPGTANAIAPNLPAYANVSLSGSAIPYTWNDSGANGPLFPETPSGNGHVETAWYSNTAFSIQLNLTDGQVHRVSLYAIDWTGNLMRQEQIDIIDTATGQVLDTESIANFENGVYLTWNLSGDVTIRVTNTLQPNANAVVDALFFGAPSSPGPVITAAASATLNPATATFATLSVGAADPNYDSSTLTYTWAVTSAPTGARTPTFASNGTFGSQSTRTTFYQAGTYTFMVTITDPSSLTATSSVTVTVAQTPTAITVTPASVTVADGATQMFTATATATDQFGQALAQQPTFTWSVDSGGAGGTINGSGLYTAPASGSGTDTVRATSGAVSGTAAVTVTATVGGTSASASFVGTDTATQGNWLGTYGQEGYDIAPGTANAIAPNLPAYANVSFSSSAIPYTWNDSGANGPLFPETPSGNGHVETAWYSNTAFSIQLNLIDGQVHRVSLYAIDWVGNLMRQEQIDIINTATGQVLDTESIANFANGVYLTWNLSGDVTIRVTNTLQPNANAVVNALFFGSPATAAAPASASFVGTDTTTQGNWLGTYGQDGYDIAPGTANAIAPNLPAYANVSFSGSAIPYTWNDSGANGPLFPETPSGNGHVETAWYSNTAFSIQLNLTDGQVHRVSLYAIDWTGNLMRQEQIDIIDTATGQVLDAESIANFANGVYLTWDLSGDVTIRVTNSLEPNANAVVNALFFDD